MAYNYTCATPSPLSLLFTRGLKLKHPCKFFVCRIPSNDPFDFIFERSFSLSPSEGIRIVESFDQSLMERYEGNKVGMRIEYPFYSHTSEKSLHRTPLSLKRIRFYFIRVVRYNLSRFVWREGWKAEPAAAAAVVETRRNERSTRVRTLKNGGSLCSLSDGVNPLSHRFHGVLCFLRLFLSLSLNSL